MIETTPTGNDAIVLAGYEAFARGDMPALARLFAPDAVWTHRNAGRFGGPKRGFDAIAAFFGESVDLSGGSMRVEPRAAIGEGDTVAVLTHMTGRRPDGRTLDDEQVHLFHMRDGVAVAVDQYIGDPAAVEAFWA
jgi:ketosteroid isomerase-like protein